MRTPCAQVAQSIPRIFNSTRLYLGPGLRWHEQHQQDRRQMHGSHRLYRRQKKYVKLTPNLNFSSGWKGACWYAGKSMPPSSPYCL